MPATPDLRTLIDNFAINLSTLMRRAALEEVHAKLSLVIGETAPKRRGPGRPRKVATPQKKRGKRTAADLEAFSDQLLAHVKANPGQRAEQIAAALGTDVGTMRLPMQKLIAEKKVCTEGQRRGTMYFAGAGKAKRGAAKKKTKRAGAKRGGKARRAKKRPAAGVVIKPQPRPEPPKPEPVVAVQVPVTTGAE